MKDMLYDFINNCTSVIAVDVDEDDIVADYDYLVSFKNNNETVRNIDILKYRIEKKFNIHVHLLYDQLGDQLAEGNDVITIDFYCYEGDNMEKFNQKLKELEGIIILRSIIYEYDANYLGVETLKSFCNDADDLKIDLPLPRLVLDDSDPDEIIYLEDLDQLYNSDYDALTEIYNRWIELINEKYEQVRGELISLHQNLYI